MLGLSLRAHVPRLPVDLPRRCGLAAKPRVLPRTSLPPARTMTAEAGPGPGQRVDEKEVHLISLFNAACAHEWGRLPELARAFYAAGGSSLELTATTRFVVTCVARCIRGDQRVDTV